MATFLPLGLRRAFQDERRAIVVESVGDDVVIGRQTPRGHEEVGRVDVAARDPATITKALSKLVRKARRGRAEVVLRLPTGQVLQKILNLPLAAEENLRQVLSFEMDRQTPFKASEVYFDHRVHRRDLELRRLTVELVLVPRAVVDSAVERVRAWGIVPEAVDVRDDEWWSRASMNFLPQEHGTSASTWGGKMTVALAALAMALAATAAYIPIDQARQQAEIQWNKATVAQSQAKMARRLRDEIDQLTVSGRFLVDKKRQSPTVTEALDELTRLVPDDSWLMQIQVRGGEVLISGYSRAASELIGFVERSPVFRNAKFRAIVTQDANVGLERFNLSAELIAAAGQ